MKCCYCTNKYHRVTCFHWRKVEKVPGKTDFFLSTSTLRSTKYCVSMRYVEKRGSVKV